MTGSFSASILESDQAGIDLKPKSGCTAYVGFRATGAWD
jgi:hypothetical protein